MQRVQSSTSTQQRGCGVWVGEARGLHGAGEGEGRCDLKAPAVLGGQSAVASHLHSPQTLWSELVWSRSPTKTRDNNSEQ